jgi:hypothetical protein
MTVRSELELKGTEELRALLAKKDTMNPGKVGTIARVIQEREQLHATERGELKPGLLDAQMDWIDSL